MCLNDADGMENRVDPDQTAPKEQSDLDLHCLLRPSPVPISKNVFSALKH